MQPVPKAGRSFGKTASGGPTDRPILRVVLDINLLVSALLRHDSIPGAVLEAWQQNRYDLLTHPIQLEELRDVMRRKHIRDPVRPSQVGRLVNQLQRKAEMVHRLPRVERSPDPADDFLLALCQAGRADYLVTGDRRDLLALRTDGTTMIVTARRLGDTLGVLPSE